MAFVCTIDRTWAQGAGFDWEGESTLVAGIGYDDEHPVSYSIVLSLSPSPGEVEFIFYVVADNEQTSQVQYYFSGRETLFIPKDDRQKVLRAALMAARLLVDHCKPDRFFMITVDADMPPKAMVKSEWFCRVFTDAGYRVSDTFFQHGKAWWSLERVAEPDVPE